MTSLKCNCGKCKVCREQVQDAIYERAFNDGFNHGIAQGIEERKKLEREAVEEFNNLCDGGWMDEVNYIEWFKERLGL